MTSVLKKSRGTKGKSESMQEDLPPRWGSNGNQLEEVTKLTKFIDDNVIGKGNSFCGPFGRRKVVYCDYSGSGRSQQWIEDHVSNEVLPTHAAPCTALSYTSGQSDFYRSESREIVRSAVGASSEDVVLLGATLKRFIRALHLQKVALFVSSRETERQLTPWKECQTEIIKIAESKEGYIDLNNLESKLQEYSGTGKRMIGFFPAASKLTGVFADDVATTILLHQYGAWAFWDYTLVAATSLVDMNPTFPGVEDQMVKKDAMFFDCEKLIGGVQGPQVVVAKKDVFRNTQLYSDDIKILRDRLEDCQDSATVRAALAMRLKDWLPPQYIAERQDKITRQVLSHIKNIPELILLGGEPTMRRLPIFSLMVKHPRGTFLHHNFICAILNDVFGIQAKGGLNSNMSYGHDVLGIDEKLLREYEKLLDVETQKEAAKLRKISDVKAPETPIHNEHLRPGFFRLSFPFFMSDSELAFILEALKMVATEGWKILPQYVGNPITGQWRHHSCSILRDKKSLYSLRFHDGSVIVNERRISGPGIFPQTYTECLQTARNLFNRARKLAMKCSTAEPEVSFNPKIDYLRWFMLPKEAHDLLLGKSANVKHIVPFDPSGYTGARKSLNTCRSAILSSPILGSSPRHFSLSAIDDCHIFRLKQKQKYCRVTSLKETLTEGKVETYKSPPVQFAVGESVSPIRTGPKPLLIRSRCYSLGSESPPALLNITNVTENVTDSGKTNSYCNCGSQTDLQSLDDPMISPAKLFLYGTQNSASFSDSSQTGRASPTTSLASHTSEDIHAYVKEMTKEIATEIKSEIREVISQVDDILENSDSLEQPSTSITSISSQSEKNVSVTDVAQYLMGMSREMASEVKHEIREMVNQVDEMMPSGSRKSSPPQLSRNRLGSGPDLGLDLNKTTSLRKCPTSPVLSQCANEASFSKVSPKSHCDSSGPSSISFNSSETSTPDTIIQVVSSQNSPSLPKSLSSVKLSDDEACSDLACRHCCVKKNWCQNQSVSSQDSGINMSFTETDACSDFVKWRTSSDPTTNKAKKLQGRLRMCQRHEKSEVPDIIEGVPVCSTEYAEYAKRQKNNSDPGRVMFQDAASGSRPISSDFNHPSRSSTLSSSSSKSSGYGTDLPRLQSQEENDFDRGESSNRFFDTNTWDDDSSDASLTETTSDDDGKWHCPPKNVWKPTVEAIHEYNMIRPGDKVLVCLSGNSDSVALLHAIHQYQFYARAKGIHFTIGALFVHEPRSEVDPLHLMAYCRTLGVKFIYQDQIEDDIPYRGAECCGVARWAVRGVRRRVYGAAGAHGFGVAAVAQHLDRAAAAFVAAAMHHGSLTCFKAHYTLREHKLRIIRPFIYVRERDLDAFACTSMLPDFRSVDCARQRQHDAHALDRKRQTEGPNASDESGSEMCRVYVDGMNVRYSSKEACVLAEPSRAPSNFQSEQIARDILQKQERLYPRLYSSLKSALHPLISSRSIEKDLKEHRHRKRSVIQMKNGVPVYDSEDGTDEEPVP